MDQTSNKTHGDGVGACVERSYRQALDFSIAGETSRRLEILQSDLPVYEALCRYLYDIADGDAYRELVGPSGQVMFGEWSEEWGHSAIDEVYSQSRPKPDAIFCGSDEIARGVVDALRDRGISIPDDVAVVGFDNWEVVSKQTRPPLTTIDMELKELGHQAGLAILGLSRREKLEPGIVRLSCSLLGRGSA
jgi:LacI family transcriptional regulator